MAIINTREAIQYMINIQRMKMTVIIPANTEYIKNQRGYPYGVVLQMQIK